MADIEAIQHDILLIIVVGIFILFATAISTPAQFPAAPIVFP